MNFVKSVTVSIFLFFIGWLWSNAYAAEHNQKAPSKSASRGTMTPQGTPGNVQRGSSEHRGGQMHPGAVDDRKEIGRQRGEIRHSENFNFRGRHYDSFSVHERIIWHSGAWRHTGNGWYWVVGGVYYSYPAPIYPYPIFVSGVVVEYPMVAPIPVAVARPPVVIVQQQAQYWYYCDNPKGYSPYVQNCSSEWRMVPVPPQAPPPPN